MLAIPRYNAGRRIIPVRSIAAWRETYNPLRELTPQRAVELYQDWRAGNYANVQLCWDALEEYDDILSTLVEKRVSALSEMEITVKTASDVSDDNPELKAQAEAQREAVANLYNRVINMRDAIDHLALASFRGYAHLEIFRDGDDIQLIPVDQWFWARQRRRGQWYYNPDANPTMGDLHETDMGCIIVREVARPIDIVAMFAITVKSHGEAGWDGFLDVFGNPALFFEYPPDTSDEQAREYDAIINDILGDGRGGFPNGGKITPVETTAQGGVTFQERCDWANKKMIYKATGGLLTVLAESGTGTLAGNAHMDAFDALGRRDAASIAECLNRQLTDRYLRLKFPGQRKLAYITLENAATEDVSAQVTNIATLAAAGYRVGDDQVTEITGLDVTSANMDSTALYAAKAVGYVPTQGALQQRMGMPIEPAPSMLIDPSGANHAPVTNRGDVSPQQAPPLNAAEADSRPLTEEEAKLLQSLMRAPTAADMEAAPETDLLERMMQAAATLTPDKQ